MTSCETAPARQHPHQERPHPRIRPGQGLPRIPDRHVVGVLRPGDVDEGLAHVPVKRPHELPALAVQLVDALRDRPFGAVFLRDRRRRAVCATLLPAPPAPPFRSAVPAGRSLPVARPGCSRCLPPAAPSGPQRRVTYAAGPAPSSAAPAPSARPPCTRSGACSAASAASGTGRAPAISAAKPATGSLSAVSVTGDIIMCAMPPRTRQRAANPSPKPTPAPTPSSTHALDARLPRLRGDLHRPRHDQS